MAGAQQTWKRGLGEARDLIQKLSNDTSFINQCAEFSDRLVDLYKRGGNLFACGNGGSHCDAMHFAEELTGRFHKDRAPLGALALGDPSHVTCVSNDMGFDHVFERQVSALGRRGDLLVGFSTSGNSKNVLLALEAAKNKGMTTVALLGRDGGKIKEVVDLALIVPAQDSGRIQEIHIKLVHTAIEALERELFPQNYT